MDRHPIPRKWESYEKVAAHLLDQFAVEFGLERVEGKQHIQGQYSGTKWEIDAKGIREGHVGFVIIEMPPHSFETKPRKNRRTRLSDH